MHLLKQSTAASVLVGPVLDSTGAAYTGMAIGDFNITKNGTTAALAAAASVVHDHNGHYLLSLTTGNTDTLGRLAISCNKATYAMPAKSLEVLPAATFDAIVTNAAGGVTRGSLVQNAALAEATINLSRLFGWHGAQFFVALLGTNGVNPEQFVGDLQGVLATSAPAGKVRSDRSGLSSLSGVTATSAPVKRPSGLSARTAIRAAGPVE